MPTSSTRFARLGERAPEAAFGRRDVRERRVFAKGPIGRHARLICIIPRGTVRPKVLADHRKSVRPLRKEARWERDRDARRMEMPEVQAAGYRECARASRKRGGERRRERPAWLARARKNASTLPPTAHRLNRRSFPLSFLLSH